MPVSLRHDLVRDLVKPDAARDRDEGCREPQGDQERKLTAGIESAERHGVGEGQRGAEGEDRDPELEELLAAEPDTRPWSRRFRREVDRRRGVVGTRSSHPVPGRCLRI